MILLLKKIYIYVCLITYFIHPVIIFSIDYISDTILRSNFNHRIAQKYDDTFESIQCVIVKWERGCNNFHIQRSCMLVKVDYSSGRNYIKQTRRLHFINNYCCKLLPSCPGINCVSQIDDKSHWKFTVINVAASWQLKLIQIQ